MTRVPSAARVSRALRGVRKELRGSLKQVHQQAAKLLAKGDYAGAQTLVDAARSVKAFDAEVESLAKKWVGVRGGPTKSLAGDSTPLWAYYRIILQALSASDGRLPTSELIKHMEPIAKTTLKPTDFEPTSAGRPRWQAMVRKARRHMVKEGFIEGATGSEWRITTAGRRSIAHDVSK
ncbi:MAG: hypothetical protein ABJF01_19065 [bacterium]